MIVIRNPKNLDFQGLILLIVTEQQDARVQTCLISGNSMDALNIAISSFLVQMHFSIFLRFFLVQCWIKSISFGTPNVEG